MKANVYVGGPKKISVIIDEYGSFFYPSTTFIQRQLDYYKINYQEPTGRKQIVCRTKKQANRVLADLGSPHRIK